MNLASKVASILAKKNKITVDGIQGKMTIRRPTYEEGENTLRQTEGNTKGLKLVKNLAHRLDDTTYEKVYEMSKGIYPEWKQVTIEDKTYNARVNGRSKLLELQDPDDPHIYTSK